MPDVMGARGIGAGERPTQYRRMRETPWVSAVLGHCYGSSSWYAALSDFVVMRKGAVMGAPLPLSASLTVAWPQIVGLIAATILLVGAGYVAFQRQEVRA